MFISLNVAIAWDSLGCGESWLQNWRKEDFCLHLVLKIRVDQRNISDKEMA
jgi:hypothetical protein